MWRILARRAVTKEWLSWDVPLDVTDIGWSLSAPGTLRGSVSPETAGLTASDGRPLLEEWGTQLFVEDGGALRWGGIVARCEWTGQTWAVEATGFSSYPHQRVYRGDRVVMGADPTYEIMHLWENAQSGPDADIGVTVAGDVTGVRLGEYGYAVDSNGVRLDYAIPHAQWAEMYKAGWKGGIVPYALDAGHDVWVWLLDNGYTQRANGDLLPPATWNQRFANWERSLLDSGWGGGPVPSSLPAATLDYLKSHGWAYVDVPDPASPVHGLTESGIYSPTQNPDVLGSDARIEQPKPYEIHGWEARYIGDEIAALVTETPLDYIERVRWDGDEPRQEVVIGYPRIGRRRDDLAFVLGDNVDDVGKVGATGDEHANTIVGRGSGKGSEVLRTERTVHDGRIARDYVWTDQSITDERRLSAMLTREAAYRAAGLRITGLSVVDHPHAPIGSWEVGDDILFRGNLPWLGEVEMWLRITGWSLTGSDTATIQVTPTETYRR